MSYFSDGTGKNTENSTGYILRKMEEKNGIYK